MTYLNTENMPVFIGLSVAAIAIVIAVILFVRDLRKTADSRKISTVVKKYSDAYERDVVFSDGIGGYFFIDYLVLLQGKIIALNIARVAGYVFGGDNIDLWTQVENNKSTKFKNPLDDVKLFAKLATEQLKFDGIMAKVLFDSESEFPKGVPEGVLQLANFKESMTAWAAETTAADVTKKTWDKLAALLSESRERYNKEAGLS